VNNVQSFADRRLTGSDGGLAPRPVGNRCIECNVDGVGTGARQRHGWLTSVGSEMRIGVSAEAAVRTMAPIASIGMMACGYGSKKAWVQPTFSFFQTSIVAYSRLTPSFWTAVAMLVCKMLSTFSP